MKLRHLVLLTASFGATLALRASADPPTVATRQNDTRGAEPYITQPQAERAARQPLVRPDANIVWTNGTTPLTIQWQPDWAGPPTMPTIPTTRVALDVNKVRIADALKKLFAQVGERYELDSDVPANTRITLRVRNVSFLTALQAMVEQADLSWTFQTPTKGEPRPALYKIGKQSTMVLTTPWIDSRFYPRYIPWRLQDNGPMFLPWSQDNSPTYISGSGQPNPYPYWNIQMGPNYWFDTPTSSGTPGTRTFIVPGVTITPDVITAPVGSSLHADMPSGNRINLPGSANSALTEVNGVAQNGIIVNKVPLLSDIPLIGNFFTTRTREERSIFTCPHCHGQVTVVRKHETPICPECGRTFEVQWKVCPFDGAKRPVVAGEWQFCPICGKSIGGAESTRKKQ
jgi:hypothetical protein